MLRPGGTASLGCLTPDALRVTIAVVAIYRAFRERAEELERASLSTWACVASESKGRDRHEEPDPLRTVFADDVDRIVAARAFRGLAGKSARLPALPGRTRLTQTLEVSRLARALSRALRLNEDMTEAVATGVALGQPPFGQAGPEALSTFITTPFDSGQQALRIVELLEAHGRGLNLTWEVRDGILHAASSGQQASTAEGQAVAVSARIVRVAGTLRDAVGDGVLEAADVVTRGGGLLRSDPHEWPVLLLRDAVRASLDKPQVALSQSASVVLRDLSVLVAERLDDHPVARADHDRAVHCLRSLLVYALEQGDRPSQRVLDELSALTDADALARYRSLFEPHS